MRLFGMHWIALFALGLWAGACASDQPRLLDRAHNPLLTPPAQTASPNLVVMNLAAHPDDEDGRTLTYYRKAKNAVAYSVIYTRGEGGQNEIGPDLYEALGALRTEETERAARILGTQIFFLNFKDFGYSKTAQESFEKWGGEDEVTARLTYLIRKLKPDVLFTNHDTVTVGSRRQHGHHQAVGLSAYAAFTLANDPTFHPEQLTEEGVDLWQPKRLFLRHWREPDQYDVAVPVGDRYAPEDRTYSEMAGYALREHASQGMDQFVDRFIQPDQPPTYFSLLHSATDAPLDPVDLAGNLPTRPVPAPYEPHALATADEAERRHPHVTYWLDAGRLPTLPHDFFQVDDAIIVPGQTVNLRWMPANLPPEPMTLHFSGAVDTTLTISRETPPLLALTLPETAHPTLPKAERQYDRFRNHPPIYYTFAPEERAGLVAGGYLPLEIAPPIVLQPMADVVRLRSGSQTLTARVQSFASPPQPIDLTLRIHPKNESNPYLFEQTQTVTFQENGWGETTFTPTLPADLPQGPYTIQLTEASATLAQPAQVFETSVAEGLKVGVIQSYDDALQHALRELGVSYQMLDSLALAQDDFDDLHTIVVDIRAYLVRADLRVHNARLLDWVKRGGHLIVNYQKTFEWNPAYDDPFLADQKNPENFAPYPLELGRDRVTREDAPVTILAPEHPLFQVPNLIQPKDWAGWVQERGLYFPETYDSQYLELLAMHDPQEAPLHSSTLLATYGEGTYLYTALGWYRQLKVFNSGAYNLFANMISLPLTQSSEALAGGF